MEYEKELQKLGRIKDMIIRTKNYSKKRLLIRDYFSLVAYLDKLLIIDGEKYIADLKQDFDMFIKESNNEKIKYCNKYLKNFNYIICLTDELINLYDKYSFPKEKIFFDDSINFQDGMEALYSFFSLLGDDFYQLFVKLNQDGRISLINNLDADGFAYNTSYSDKSYILLNDHGSRYTVLSSLAHEMGHCYEFMLTRGGQEICPAHNLAEVPSLFMQRLFDDYMMNFDNYDKQVKFNKSIWQNVLYHRTSSNYFTNQMYANDLIEALDYERGIFMFKNTIIEQFINVNNYDSIIEYKPAIDNYLYVICDIIALNLVKIYHDSPKEALEVLKKIILNHSKYQKILINYAFDLGETEKMIKETSMYIKEFGKNGK